MIESGLFNYWTPLKVVVFFLGLMENLQVKSHELSCFTFNNCLYLIKFIGMKWVIASLKQTQTTIDP